MEKIYSKGIYFKTVTTSFGNILKTNINTAQFTEWLKANTNEKGYCNIDILERKEVGKYGETHYSVLNTYVPKQEAKQDKAPDLGISNNDVLDLPEGEDLPF